MEIEPNKEKEKNYIKQEKDLENLNIEEEIKIRGEILRDRIKLIEYSLSSANLNKYKEIMEEIQAYPIDFFNRNPFIRESFMCLYEYFSSFQTFDDYLLMHKLFHSWVNLYKYIAGNNLLKTRMKLSNDMKENVPKFEMLLKDIDKMSTRKYKAYKNHKNDARYKITHKRAKYCNFPYLGKLPEELERDVFEFDGQIHRPSTYIYNMEPLDDPGDICEENEQNKCDEQYLDMLF